MHNTYSELKSKPSHLFPKDQNLLTKQRWLVYHADKQARAKELIDAGILTQDTCSVVIEFLGHYHHVPEHPLLLDTIPTDAELKETRETMALADEIYFGNSRRTLRTKIKEDHGS